MIALDVPGRLLVSCVLFFVIQYAFGRLGLRKWPAYAATFALMLGVAALREFAGGRL